MIGSAAWSSTLRGLQCVSDGTTGVPSYELLGDLFRYIRVPLHLAIEFEVGPIWPHLGLDLFGVHWCMWFTRPSH